MMIDEYCTKDIQSRIEMANQCLWRKKEFTGKMNLQQKKK